MTPTTLTLERYEDQLAHWPTTGKHILAQFDERTIVVYQAYRPDIGKHAARTGRFGGGFSFSRMSWIKPNFLWMMFRSGWGTKVDQEITLAIHITRAGFDEILSHAVASSFGASGFATTEEWERALAASDVRLQWDPDHAPSGKPIERRAIQLGLRGKALRDFDASWIVSIEDISSWVTSCRGVDPTKLVIPRERPFPSRKIF